MQSTVTQHDYLYDALGRRERGTDKVGFFSQPATAETFAYDALHNRTQRIATGVDERFGFDAANQLKEIRNGPANALTGALVYDANGNLKKKCTGGGVSSTATDCAGSNVLTLTFDAANRLSQAQGPNGTETYGYDDQGRRIRKTVNGANTFYLYNGADVVAEYGEGWTKPSAVTLHGAGTDDPIARYTRNGSGAYDKAYYHADGLGSVVALTRDDGTLTGAQMFDSWGAKIATSSIGEVPAFGYTGREPDATGLIYYRARYYDPAIGRFVSQDPIGIEGGPNLYAYVDNSPVNYTDPSGNCPSCLLGGLANVGLGWGLSRISGQDYNWKQAGRDFGIGAATSGVAAIAQTRNVYRAAQALRTEGRIMGSAQNTANSASSLTTKISGAAHEYRATYEAVRAAQASPEATVFLNRSYSTASNHATQALQRPDVFVRSGSGQLNAIEVASKTDNVSMIFARNQAAMQTLPTSMQGEVAVIESISVLGTRFAAAPPIGLNYVATGVGLGRFGQEVSGLGAFATAIPIAPYTGGVHVGLTAGK